MIDIDEQKKKIMDLVAARIKYFRHIRSFSQEETAFRANINPAYFGQVERGLRCPTIDTLYKIATALEIPITELLRSDNLPNYTEDYSQSIKNLLVHIPSNKIEQVLKIVKDVTELF